MASNVLATKSDLRELEMRIYKYFGATHPCQGNNFERTSDLRNLLFNRLDCTADLVGSKFGR